MMTIAGTEALAGLQLLVAVAKADSELTNDERWVIGEALEDANLHQGITARALTESSCDVDELIAQIRSQHARDVAFGACVTMANANRVCLPKQQAILDKIETAWDVPEEMKSVVVRALEESKRLEWLTPLEPESDHGRRAARIQDDILRNSVLAAVLGLDPQPFVSVATDLAVVALQAEMFRDVGRAWGRDATPEAVRHLIAGLGVGTGARVAFTGLLKFAPGAGAAFAASTNFDSTWALGQVANRYWESGAEADLDSAGLAKLRETFERSKHEGRGLYELHRDEIEAKHRAHVALINELAGEYKAGRITLAGYERRVAELK